MIKKICSGNNCRTYIILKPVNYLSFYYNRIVEARDILLSWNKTFSEIIICILLKRAIAQVSAETTERQTICERLLKRLNNIVSRGGCIRNGIFTELGLFVHPKQKVYKL